ncbi:MAG: hypothetical protein H6713_03620 [Myxococcales bacterium]|nr:hypothetical protein [Myxococcales bacterium]MCB9749077.1 hypothetical protein [Myxococcales bacterium]
MEPPHIARITQNPFHVLGLRPGCSRAELERAGQTLLDMLAVDMRDAREYMTPLGPRARTAELVRHAMAELREPTRRVVHELWASRDQAAAAPRQPRTSPLSDDDAERDGWHGGFRALGWRTP